MLTKVAAIFKAIYNEYKKQYDTITPPTFGAWFVQSEEYRKVNPTTAHLEITKLFQGVDYYG